MMRFFLAIAFLGLSVIGYSQDKKERHVFLLIGQSNMAGRAKIEEADKKPIAGAFLWHIGEKKWEAAAPPYNLHSPSRKPVNMQRLNSGPSFAKTYLEKHPGVEIGIVCAARGGTSIKQWDREKPDKFDLYRHAIEAAQAALETGGELKGILWHQGEQDVVNETVDVYPEKLKQLVANLRMDLKMPKVPFIASQIGQWRADFKRFNEMVVKQSGAILNFGCITTEDLKNFDSWHFDSASQQEMGKRYAAALEKLISKK